MQKTEQGQRLPPARPAAATHDFVPRVQALFNRLVESGARYDAAPLYPQESVETLRAAGLHRLFAPPESGGESFTDARAENTALMNVLRIVGRADLSLGRIFEGHVNALKLFAWFGSAAQKAKLTLSLRDVGLDGHARRVGRLGR